NSLIKKINKISWYNKANNSWDNWEYKINLNQNTSLSKPVKENTFFYANEEVKKRYWNIFFRNILLLFPGTFKEPTNVNLSDFVLKERPRSRSKDIKIQWIGHSSFLVQINNQNILIDPNFSTFVFPCFKRHTPVGIDFKNLPKIDTILISHNHVDHLDEVTLDKLKKYEPTLLVPLGLKDFFVKKGFEKVFEHNWWDETISTCGKSKVSFTAVPAQHWSQPLGNMKGNESLFCGWVIKANNKTIYHAGDTAYSEKMFNEIKNKFHSFTYALLPTAPENEEDMHMGVNSFLKAKEKFSAYHTIPMHWGAFRTGAERIEDPVNDLKMKIKLNNLSGIRILKIGQIFDSRINALSLVA
ncbi:MAG: MBL fold metallo-hydrolase, partial [Parachlamydiales bacterium]|nr:MBL fold metallo-hydrolase [Parachlamydiales bacterium]